MHAKYKALIILGTLALILGGIALYRKPAIAPVIINHQENNQSTSTVGSELKDWKTYRNDEYGFEFRYPDTFGELRFEDSSILIGQIRIRVNAVDSICSAAEYLNKITREEKGPWSYGDPEIFNSVNSGVSAIEYDSAPIYPGSFPGDEIAVLKNSCQNKYAVTFYLRAGIFQENGKFVPLSDYDEQLIMMRKIVSTFNFTNQRPDTTGWNIYRNEEYGFELKFPPRWSTMQVRENGFSFYLKLEDSEEYDSVCGIKMYKEDNWYKLINDYNEPHPSADEYLGTDENGWVYAYTCGQDDYGFAGFENYNEKIRKTGYYGGGQGPYYDFRKLIVPTFKFIK